MRGRSMAMQTNGRRVRCTLALSAVLAVMVVVVGCCCGPTYAETAPATATCKDGAGLFRDEANNIVGCYKYFSRKLTWTQAKAFCEQSEGFGGQLAAARSEAEETFLVQLVPGKREFWIGANALEADGIWRWTGFSMAVSFNQDWIDIESSDWDQRQSQVIKIREEDEATGPTWLYATPNLDTLPVVCRKKACGPNEDVVGGICSPNAPSVSSSSANLDWVAAAVIVPLAILMAVAAYVYKYKQQAWNKAKRVVCCETCCENGADSASPHVEELMMENEKLRSELVGVRSRAGSMQWTKVGDIDSSRPGSRAGVLPGNIGDAANAYHRTSSMRSVAAMTDGDGDANTQAVQPLAKVTETSLEEVLPPLKPQAETNSNNNGTENGNGSGPASGQAQVARSASTASAYDSKGAAGQEQQHPGNQGGLEYKLSFGDRLRERKQQQEQQQGPGSAPIRLRAVSSAVGTASDGGGGSGNGVSLSMPRRLPSVIARAGGVVGGGLARPLRLSSRGSQDGASSQLQPSARAPLLNTATAQFQPQGAATVPPGAADESTPVGEQEKAGGANQASGDTSVTKGESSDRRGSLGLRASLPVLRKRTAVVAPAFQAEAAPGIGADVQDGSNGDQQHKEDDPRQETNRASSTEESHSQQ